MFGIDGWAWQVLALVVGGYLSFVGLLVLMVLEWVSDQPSVAGVDTSEAIG